MTYVTGRKRRLMLASPDASAFQDGVLVRVVAFVLARNRYRRAVRFRYGSRPATGFINELKD